MNAEEVLLIQQWSQAVRARSKLPLAERADFTGSGDPRLDNGVAKILLETVQAQLPSWGHVNGGEVVLTRDVTREAPRSLQLLPQHLVTINWGDSGPGVSWPEAYYVTFVPALGIRCVTASADSDDNWGFTDLAIGCCRARGDATYGVRAILVNWWRICRALGLEPWESVIAEGSVPVERVLGWRGAVWGKGGGSVPDLWEY